MGDYVCRATNDRLSIEGTVTVSVQAVPVFTIPLGDMHMDRGEDLVWTCEAFGIPDVNYRWLRNGMVKFLFFSPGDPTLIGSKMIVTPIGVASTVD